MLQTKILEAIQKGILESLNVQKPSNGLYRYEGWKEFQDDINEIGWENFVLYNPYKENHAWKRKSSGHYVMNMKDPREDN